MKKFITGCLAIALLLFGQILQAVPTSVLNGSGQYTGINGLDVGGVLYDVEFKEGTYNQVFGGTFDFTTAGSAATAATAIFSALPSTFPALDADPTLMFGCQQVGNLACFILTPYSFDTLPESTPGAVNAIAMRNGKESESVQNGNFGFVIDPTFSTVTNIDNLGQAFVWADWTPSGGGGGSTVPEPGTLALIALAMLGLSAARVRRR